MTDTLVPLLVLLVAVPLTVKVLRWYVGSVDVPRDRARTDAARLTRERGRRS